jgi:D-lactate dehydrogenase (cytochrome)
MERMNRIKNISREGMYSVVEAGVLVEHFKDACGKKSLFYTSHPTEKTAFIGGTISTNASGARSFKYGATRHFVKRLKMVLPTGEILEVRRGERVLERGDSAVRLENGRIIDIPMPTYKMPRVKNAAGYFAKDGMDLIDLFIGQEGTLSVVIEAELGLVRKPEKLLSSFVFFGNEPDAWDFADEGRRISGNSSSKDKGCLDALSIEYLDCNALNLLNDKEIGVPPGAKTAIFFEQEISADDEDISIDKWSELINRHGASADNTWVAMSEREIEHFAEIRHLVPEVINEMVKRRGFQKLSTDIAVPADNCREMLEFYRDTLERENLEHIIFGHIGESHLHMNILPRSQAELEKGRILCLEFCRKAVALGGTVSAEHGIGKTRHDYLEAMYGASGILEMARVKKAFDPNCILGLDNIFPKEVLKKV